MFKWTIPRTWVGGEKPPAVVLNDHIRNNFEALNGYVRKSVDESVTSSAALQNDDHLSFAIPQAGSYVFELYLDVVSAANAAGDIKVGFAFPSGTLRFSGQGPDVGLAAGAVQTGQWFTHLSATSGVSNINFGCSTTTVTVQIHGLLIATAAGTLQTMWSQDASNANATTVKAGSHMTIKQVP